MSVFTSGANGANVLDSILSGGSIVNRTVSTSEVVATYTDGSTSILYGSQSPEFLSDVQVTATPNTQHWLVVG